MWKRSVLQMPNWIILILVTVQVGIITASRLAYWKVESDPLAPYEAMMPGRSLTALQQFRICLSEEVTTLIGMVTYCTEGHVAWPIQAVVATVSMPASTIVQLAFEVDGLSLGDLVLLWGKPDEIKTYSEVAFARWRRGIYRTTARLETNGRCSYWSPIRSIVIG